MSALVGFEHVGTTSADLDRTVDFYVRLLGMTLVLRKRVASGELAFLATGGAMLEILAPDRDTARASDVPDLTAGLRHLTFAVTDVDAMLARLADAGVEIAEKPRDAHNRELISRVAFVRDPDGILVELIERAPGHPANATG